MKFSQKRPVDRRQTPQKIFLKLFFFSKFPRFVSAGHGRVRRKIFQLNAKALIHLAAARSIVGEQNSTNRWKIHFFWIRDMVKRRVAWKCENSWPHAAASSHRPNRPIRREFSLKCVHSGVAHHPADRRGFPHDCCVLFLLEIMKSFTRKQKRNAREPTHFVRLRSRDLSLVSTWKAPKWMNSISGEARGVSLNVITWLDLVNLKRFLNGQNQNFTLSQFEENPIFLWLRSTAT